MREAFRLAEVGLALPQRFLRAFSLGDVRPDGTDGEGRGPRVVERELAREKDVLLPAQLEGLLVGDRTALPVDGRIGPLMMLRALGREDHAIGLPRDLA